MKNKKFDYVIVMIRRFVSIGFVLLFLICFLGTGCANFSNNQNGNGKSGFLALPSKFIKSDANSKKVKKASDTPRTLDEILGMERP
ncbi:MAG: hypothetical protein LBE18_04430 [Planctomycetaceae bacterium]|nr:hypothetical protein [Planctomycetaceae bacterium]